MGWVAIGPEKKRAVGCYGAPLVVHPKKRNAPSKFIVVGIGRQQRSRLRIDRSDHEWRHLTSCRPQYKLRKMGDREFARAPGYVSQTQPENLHRRLGRHKHQQLLIDTIAA